MDTDETRIGEESWMIRPSFLSYPCFIRVNLWREILWKIKGAS